MIDKQNVIINNIEAKQMLAENQIIPAGPIIRSMAIIDGAVMPANDCDAKLKSKVKPSPKKQTDRK